ncbi:MAG: hypothetical protein IPF66_13080 [Holophagales bacterium]|nr:hypothetical protein [Holophagales bacterium]
MGTISAPPGQHPPAAPTVSAFTSSGTGWSPWKLALFALAGLAAVLYFRRPSYLPDLALASATAGGTPSGSSAAPIHCTGASGCLVVYVAPWCGPCRSSLPSSGSPESAAIE